MVEEDPLGYLQLLRLLSKTCAAAREPLKALYEEAAKSGKLAAMLTTYLAMLNGPNCTEVGGGGRE